MPEYPKPTRGDLKKAREILRKRRRQSISIMEASNPAPQDAPYPSSYFGGLPFLPEGVAWPRLDDGELNFLAQITLADLPRIEGSPLPTHGRLLFFSRTDFDDNPGPGDSAVIFAPDPASGSPTQPPPSLRRVGNDGAHPGVEPLFDLRFAATDSYPSWHAFPRKPARVLKVYHFVRGQSTEISESEAKSLTGEGQIVKVMAEESADGVEIAFHDVREELCNEALDAAWPERDFRPSHQILGYGENIQGAARDNEANILLLQLDGSPFSHWLSGGALIFWITPDDLRRRDFARAFTTGEWS